MDEERVVCETADSGEEAHTHPQVEVRPAGRTILEIVAESVDGVEFRNLSGLIEGRLSTEQRENLGSVSWYTVSVKLDMEVKGDIERVPRAKPQKLRLVK